MPIPLRFYLESSSDHASPGLDTPTVSIWTPGAGAWFTPSGVLASSGSGWWTVAANAVDQAGGSPLLLYATASDSDPTAKFFLVGAAWAQGQATPPLPFWMGTTASNGYSPAAGLSPLPSVSVSSGGSFFAAGLGSVSEPGGTNNGNGWYLYYPAASEMTGTDIALLATATGALDWSIDYPITPATAAGAGSGNVPSQTAPLFANDEGCLAYAAGDFAMLVPAWQVNAQGADGVFAPSVPWVLTSASVDFNAYGVLPNQVVWLTAPKGNFPGGGQFLAIDSVAPNQITLRRVFQGLNVGMPPAPATGLTGVTFAVMTLLPQIAEASYDLKNRFAVDDNPIMGQYRSTPWIYDQQVFRQATIFTVLYERYSSETRTDKGDFKEKVARYKAKMNEAIDRLQVRWGPTGNDQPPTTLFSCRLSR